MTMQKSARPVPEEECQPHGLRLLPSATPPCFPIQQALREIGTPWRLVDSTRRLDFAPVLRLALAVLLGTAFLCNKLSPIRCSEAAHSTGGASKGTADQFK